jgi:hypothetical protein
MHDESMMKLARADLLYLLNVGSREAAYHQKSIFGQMRRKTVFAGQRKKVD